MHAGQDRCRTEGMKVNRGTLYLFRAYNSWERGLSAYFRFLKIPLIAYTEDTYVFCDIEQA